MFLAALALIISANIVELLPNATLTPWTWLLAGALLGRSELLRIRANNKTAHIPKSVIKPEPRAALTTLISSK